jgi:hypothetical protein
MLGTRFCEIHKLDAIRRAFPVSVPPTTVEDGLKRAINRMQDRLSRLAWVKRRVNKDEQRTNFEYVFG